ncbi:MAG: RNA ligase RtcB family protein [Planctomycetota bacterium]
MASIGLTMGSSKTSHLFSPGTWVDHQAILQMGKTAEFPGMVHVFGMPDLHVGKVGPVGAAFHSVDVIYPELVGGDIGCGMHLGATDIPARGHAVQKRLRRLGSIDEPWAGETRALAASHDLDESRYERGLGTIGGGNHFAELQVVHEIADAEAASRIGIDPELALVLIHSGSRGLGQSVLESHLGESAGAGRAVPADSNAGKSYISGHEQARRFARANRELIAHRFAEGLGSKSSPLLDIGHNFLEQVEIGGAKTWIHRKGAAPSDRGPVVIPGSRGTWSFVVEPLGDGSRNGFSLAHGAGRKIPRGHCREKFMDSYTREELLSVNDKKLDIKSHVVCGDRDLVFEEHPKAYKDIRQVIGDMVDLGIIKVVAILKPVLTYKTSGTADDGDG